MGILLPNDKFKGYINLCLGLVLILMILKPLSDFLDAGVSADSLFQDQGGQQQVNISGPDAYAQIQGDMMRRSLDKHAETQMTGICADAGFQLVSVNVKANGDYTSLSEIYLTVKKSVTGGRPFIYVEPSASEKSLAINSLKNTLSEVYNMSLDNIHITETE